VPYLSVPEAIIAFAKEAKEKLSAFLDSTREIAMFGFPVVFTYTKNIDDNAIAEIIQFCNALRFSREGTAIIRETKAKIRIRRMGSKEKVVVVSQFTLQFKKKITVLLETINRKVTINLEQKEQANIQLIISPFFKHIMFVGIIKVMHMPSDKFGAYSLAVESEYDIRKLLGYTSALKEGYSILSIIREEISNIIQAMLDMLGLSLR